MNKMDDLAIIIPAYKAKYFDECLNSLAIQTRKNFKVYIGDDHSPQNLEAVIDKYRNLLDIIYHRFEYNIGAKNLVHQWNRCVQLSKKEKWIWLFSDDDIADSNCVENFYASLENKKGRFEVFRFNTCVIDEYGKLFHNTPTGPEEESSEEMAYHLLLNKRGNCMPDHIFSREIYERSNGFVFTDFAQGADWATSILFSKERGICIIPSAKLNWRYSGSNISSTAYQLRNKTMNGHLQFLKWVMRHFEYLKTAPSTINYEMIREAAKTNARQVIVNHYRGFNISFFPKLFLFYAIILRLSFFNSLKELIQIKDETSPRLKNLHIKIARYKKYFAL